MRFDNQVVMITGAAGSLGKAVAAGFAAGGARLALADVSEAVLQQAYPGTADTRLLLPANLLDSASAQNAVNAAMQKFGRLDALCNIAGGFAMGTPVHATALLQRLAAVRGRLSLCADQAAAAKWWLSMPMASVSAEGPMPKALSTRRTSPLMPGCRHQGRACPLRRARMTSNPLIVA